MTLSKPGLAVTLVRCGIRLIRPRTYAEWLSREGLARSDTEHIKAGANWLLLSQEKCRGEGYSTGYSLFSGWHAPFPETTGYIIPTMLTAAKHTKNKKYADSAVKAGNWLLTLQHKDGAFPFLTGQKFVFDTGQIIFGLLALYKHTKRKTFLEAACHAGDWLLSQQDSSGTWSKNTYQKIPRAYYARVSWALLELWSVTKKSTYRDAAKKQLSWVLSLQESDGWIKEASFFPDERPVLHTIAYTLRSLFESGRLLKDRKMQGAAKSGMDALHNAYLRDGYLASFYTKSWAPASRERCPTGMAQLALLWARSGERKYNKSIEEVKSALKKYQRIDSTHKNLKGGLPGSIPVWGEYMRGTYIGWGVKFMVDLLTVKKW